MPDTSTTPPPLANPEDQNALVDAVRTTAASAILFLHVAIREAAIPSAREASCARGFLELTSATHAAATAAVSSTHAHEMAPEVRARLDAILSTARTEVFEDGMANVVTEQLPELVTKHFLTVVPAIAGLLEAGRISSTVSAEILKELGRHRSAASHELRRWVLEHALSHPAPIARDGAALGLARMGDPKAIPHVQAAVEREPLEQLRDDLRMVLADLTAESGKTDGGASANNQ
jgi:hypothetical protein